MKKCEFLTYEFDKNGRTVLKCAATPEQCPRTRAKPPDGKIGQSCWKVKEITISPEEIEDAMYEKHMHTVVKGGLAKCADRGAELIAHMTATRTGVLNAHRRMKTNGGIGNDPVHQRRLRHLRHNGYRAMALQGTSDENVEHRIQR